MAQANLALNLLLRDSASGGIAAFASTILHGNNALTSLGSGVNVASNRLSKLQQDVAMSQQRIARYTSDLEMNRLAHQKATLAFNAAGLGLNKVQEATFGAEAAMLRSNATFMQAEERLNKLTAAGSKATQAEIDIARAQLDAAAATHDHNTQLYALAQQTEQAAIATKQHREEMAVAAMNASVLKDQEIQAAIAAEQQKSAELAAAAAAEAHAQKMQMMGGAMAGVGAAFALFLGGTMTAVGAAEDLDYAMAKVEMRVKGATDVLPAMTRQIQQLAAQSVYGAADVAAAYETLGSDAFNATQIMNGLGQESIWLGQMMGGTASAGADLLATTVHIFANEGLNATQVANMLAGSMTNGVKSGDELQRALENAGGTASMVGVKLQDFLTTVSILGQAGMNAADAGTSLRYVLGSLSNPTLKAAKELGNLGITLVDTTNPALLSLEARMNGAGKKSAQAVQDFDASTTGLKDLFDAAQAAHLIPLDQDFNSWAVSTGILSNQLYDAQGNFKGLGAAVELFKQAVEAKFPNNAQAQAAALEQIFNVRGGKGMMILEALQGFSDKYNTTWNNIGSTDAAKKAARLMDTMKGALDALHDTFISFMAAVGMQWIDWIKGAALGLNDLIQNIQDTNPWVLKFLAILLPVGTLITGLALGVGALTVAFTLLGPALAPLAIAFGVAMGGAAIIAALGTAISAANPSGGAFADWLNHARGALAQMGINLPGVTGQVKDFNSKVKDSNDKLDTMDQRLTNVQKKLDALDQQTSGLNDTVKQTPTALDTATDSIGKFISALKDRLRPEIELTQGSWDLFLRIWTVMWPDMVTIAGDALDLVIGHLQVFGDYLGGFTLAMIDILNGNWGKAWTDWTNASKAAQDHSLQNAKNWEKLFGDTNKAGMDYFLALTKDGYKQAEQAADVATSKITSDGSKIGESLDKTGEAAKKLGSNFKAGADTAKGAMSSVATSTHSGMSTAAADASAGGKAVEAAISSHFSKAAGEAKSSMAGVTSGVRSQVGPAGSAGHAVGSSVESNILSFLGRAHSWGAEIGSNLASGLRSQIGNVASAAGSLAGAIWSYLHHTEPETGPLRGDSKWGAEFAQNLAFGMTSQLPLVSQAASRVATAMAFTPAAGTMSYAGRGQGGTTHIHVHVGSKEVANVVMDDFTRQLRANGATRVFR